MISLDDVLNNSFMSFGDLIMMKNLVKDLYLGIAELETLLILSPSEIVVGLSKNFSKRKIKVIVLLLLCSLKTMRYNLMIDLDNIHFKFKKLDLVKKDMNKELPNANETKPKPSEDCKLFKINTCDDLKKLEFHINNFEIVLNNLFNLPDFSFGTFKDFMFEKFGSSINFGLPDLIFSFEGLLFDKLGTLENHLIDINIKIPKLEKIKGQIDLLLPDDPNDDPCSNLK